MDEYKKALKPLFENKFKFDKMDSFYIKLEGAAYRVISEGVKNGEKLKVNGLFCRPAIDAEYLTKYVK